MTETRPTCDSVVKITQAGETCIDAHLCEAFAAEHVCAPDIACDFHLCSAHKALLLLGTPLTVKNGSKLTQVTGA